MTVFKLIRSDFNKCKRYGGNFFSILLFTQGFWALFQYRIAHAIFVEIKVPVVRQFLLFFCLVWQKWIEVISGISLPASAKIGKAFYIGHFGNIILNANTVIGDNCNISQGVTIGISGLGQERGVPEIGNNVYIGANAVVAGKIKIGNNVLIGACSLVTKDADDNSVLMGVPAVLISQKGTEGYI